MPESGLSANLPIPAIPLPPTSGHWLTAVFTPMTVDQIEALEALDRTASAGPWYVRKLDDEMRMGAYAVCTSPDTGANEDMRSGTWPGSEVVAACLIQSPPYAVPADDRYEENAKLIAAMRTVLPELLRLARVGWKHQS